MAAIEIGRVCYKKAGREAGKKAVIVGIEKDFALIDGPNIRRKKCNIKHLFPTNEKIPIAKNASHEEIMQTFEKSLNKTTFSKKLDQNLGINPKTGHKAQEHFK